MATGSLHGVLSLVEMMLSYGTGSDQASLSPKAVVAADEFVDSLSNQFEMVCRLKDGDKLATTDCEGEMVPCLSRSACAAGERLRRVRVFGSMFRCALGRHSP